MVIIFEEVKLWLPIENYKIPKIFNTKFPRFSEKNSQDFQFLRWKSVRWLRIFAVRGWGFRCEVRNFFCECLPFVQGKY